MNLRRGTRDDVARVADLMYHLFSMPSSGQAATDYRISEHNLELMKMIAEHGEYCLGF